MTDAALSIGPDVNAVLSGSGEAPVTGMESNFSDDGAGVVNMDTTPQPAPEPEAELIAGKFKTQDDLVKAYKELESKIGQPKQEAPAEEAPEDGAVPTMGESEEQPEEAASEDEQSEETASEETSGLDFEALGSEFAEKGELSDESYEAIEKAGIPREIADTYVEGFKAIQTLRGQQLYQAAGGEAEFKALVQWGTQNLSQDQQDAFNNAVNSAILYGDFTASSMMVQAVKAQMSNGEPALLNTASGNGAPTVAPFANRSEMTEAMRDPRYRVDPDFVSQVQQRLAVSTFA